MAAIRITRLFSFKFRIGKHSLTNDSLRTGDFFTSPLLCTGCQCCLTFSVSWIGISFIQRDLYSLYNWITITIYFKKKSYIWTTGFHDQSQLKCNIGFFSFNRRTPLNNNMSVKSIKKNHCLSKRKRYCEFNIWINMWSFCTECFISLFI